MSVTRLCDACLLQAQLRFEAVYEKNRDRDIAWWERYWEKEAARQMRRMKECCAAPKTPAAAPIQAAPRETAQPSRTRIRPHETIWIRFDEVGCLPIYQYLCPDCLEKAKKRINDATAENPHRSMVWACRWWGEEERRQLRSVAEHCAL